jgi:hypothetical protein
MKIGQGHWQDMGVIQVIHTEKTIHHHNKPYVYLLSFTKVSSGTVPVLAVHSKFHRACCVDMCLSTAFTDYIQLHLTRKPSEQQLFQRQRFAFKLVVEKW